MGVIHGHLASMRGTVNFSLERPTIIVGTLASERWVAGGWRMRPVRTTAAIVMAFGLMTPAHALAVDAAALCQSKKLKAAANHMAGLLNCHASAARAGIVVDPACLSTQASRLSQLFGAADSASGCLTMGDADPLATLGATGAAEAAAMLRTAPSSSACAGSKLTTLGRRGRTLLIVHAKERKRPNDVKLVAVSADFAPSVESDFRRAEGQGGCQTTGDALARSKQIAALAGDVTERLWPASVIGLTFTHPPEWHVDPGLLALSGGTSLELNNFSVLSGRQVSARPGGATINIGRGPLPTEPLQQMIARRVSGTHDTSVSPATVGGASGTRAAYSDDFDEGIELRTVDVYVPRGAFLFQFSLSYLADDAAASSFLATFDALLASVVFTP